MPQCTVADVLTKAMSVLGDPQGEVTQEIFDDFGTSYLDLLQLLMKISSPEVTREVYFTVKANTGIIDPRSLGVPDFAEPVQLWERSPVASIGVVSLTDGTPISVTFASPPPSSQVELQGVVGVPGWVNRDWWLTPTGGNTATLNGSVTCGSDGTGGVAMYSQSPFRPMVLSDTSPFAGSQVLGSALGSYVWENGFIYVPAANVDIQVWIEYLINAAPPTSGEIGLVEGRELNFLAYATAAYFAPKRAIPQGPDITMRAFGESGLPDGTGGMLRALIVPILHQQQNLPRRSGKFRPRRTPFPFLA